MNLPEVRLAQPSDYDQVLAMCKRLHLENALFSFSDRLVQALVRKGVMPPADRVGWTDEEGPNYVTLGVIGPPDGTIEASTCVLFTTQNYYSEDWHLVELWNFVDEPYRRSRNAHALLKWNNDLALAMNVPLITGIITNKKLANKVRLYRQIYGRPAGAFFIVNGQWQTEAVTDHSELARRLKEYAERCDKQPRTIKFNTAQKEIAPLLREAFEVLRDEDGLWGPAKTNGAAAHKG
jgi:hypothetical protein